MFCHCCGSTYKVLNSSLVDQEGQRYPSLCEICYFTIVEENKIAKQNDSERTIFPQNQNEIPQPALAT